MFALPNLPPAIVHAVYADLCATLPPPATDTAEARDTRDILAMEAVASLQPATAFEALLAGQIVSTIAYGKDCLRLAGEHRDDFARTMRCCAQACAMFRQARQTQTTLDRMQTARGAVPGFARDADQRPSLPAPHPDQTQAARAPALATPPPADPALTGPRLADPAPADSDVQSDAIARAEAFALEEPLAAAQIRFDRRLTRANTARVNPAMIPSDPAVIDALINGSSLNLCVLDEIGGEQAAAD